MLIWGSKARLDSLEKQVSDLALLLNDERIKMSRLCSYFGLKVSRDKDGNHTFNLSEKSGLNKKRKK